VAHAFWGCTGYWKTGCEYKVASVRGWMEWAAGWADRIHPRTNPARAARVIAPDVSTMSEQEFAYWRDWPESAKRAAAGHGQAFEPRRVV
jgi:hypothetical protein